MTKKITALTLAILLGTSGAVMAKHHQEGGFVSNTNNDVITIKQALTMPDDSDVTLRGQIEKRLKKDKYLFKDDSGSIIVEIDDDVWKGQTVGPDDTIVIMGELDKDDDYNSIDVERLIKK